MPSCPLPISVPSDPGTFTDQPWYAWLVLGVAMILTAGGTLVLQQTIDRQDEERLAIILAATEARITQGMATSVAMLRGAAGFIDASPALDRSGFSGYLNHIDLRANYLGILGLGLSVPVGPAEVPATLAWLARQQFVRPHLWPEPPPGVMRNATVLLEPADSGNLRVIGFDMASEPARAEAMRISLARGIAQVSGPVNLLQDVRPGGVPGFVVCLPTFAHGDRRRFRGHVYAVYRGAELFSSFFPRDATAPLALRISDAASGQTLFSSDPPPPQEPSIHRTVNVLGRTWAIDAQPTAAFLVGSSRGLVPLFTTAGLLLGGGLFLLARSQVRAVARNAALYWISTVARRAAELSVDINRRLASTLDPQLVAQAVTDAGRELTGASFGTFFTLGGQAGEVAVYASSGETAPRLTAQCSPRINALFALTITGQEVVRIDDVDRDPRYAANPVPPAEHAITWPCDTCPSKPGCKTAATGADLVIASYLAVAVKSRSGAVLGGLLFTHPAPARFTVDHEALLLGLAAQAAIAFDNARLFEAERDARRIAGHRADDLGQANSELQQFIYASSHDLQEPLRTITQYLDLLQRRHGALLPDQASRYVTYAADSASRMYLLLNDLLIYSRLGREAERTQVDLSAVVTEVMRDLALVLTETRTQVVVGTLPEIRCDAAKIRSLMLNLLGNAVKFRGTADPRVTISASADVAGVWTIAVADNGIGIPPEHREAVFEVFHRLHDREKFPGTGIGLAICRRVVDQHGGRIWIEETPHGGSTFLFTLPEHASGLRRVAA